MSLPASHPSSHPLDALSPTAITRYLRNAEKEQLRALLYGPREPDTFHEPEALAGRPLAPLGAVHQSCATGPLSVEYPTLDWRVEVPADEATRPVPLHVADVYLGLVQAWRRQPDSDERSAGWVRFRRYLFLNNLGWAPRDDDRLSRSGYAGRPTGKAYRRFEAALRYLERVRISGRTEGLLNDDGTREDRLDRFVVLQRVQLSTRGAGRGRVRADAAADCAVQFSSGMIELLGQPGIALDDGVLARLPVGLPRALYRILCWARAKGRMREGGVVELPVPELLERLGYAGGRMTVSRAREILRTTHRALAEERALQGEPTVAREASPPAMCYRISDAVASRSAPTVLIEVAQALGVSGAVAHDLASRASAQLEQVLAAVLLGLIVPKRSIATAIVHYTSRRLPIFDSGHRWGHGQKDESNPFTRYLTWASGRRDALRRRRERDARWRPHTLPGGLSHVETVLQEIARRESAPDWFVEGRLQLLLHHELRIWTLQQWRARHLGAPARFESN